MYTCYGNNGRYQLILDCSLYARIARCNVWQAKSKDIFGLYFFIYLALDQDRYLLGKKTLTKSETMKRHSS